MSPSQAQGQMRVISLIEDEGVIKKDWGQVDLTLIFRTPDKETG